MAILGDYIQIKHGFAFKGDFITTEDNGVVLVTPGNFEIGGGFKEKKCKFFSADYPDDYVLHPGDLIVTMTDLSKQGDTLGFSALVPNSKRTYLHNQRIGLVDVFNPEADKGFMYWFMRTPRYQKIIVATSSGSTVKHTSPSRICEVEIDLPPLKEQKAIAAMLFSIEQKIQSNDRINDNLQQQAQAIYTAMFISNADPAWDQGRLSDLITVKYGKDHKKLADGAYPVFGSGGIMRYVERPLYTGESVLIPRKGTLNNVMYVNEPFWSVDTMFFTEMKIPNVAKFVFHFVKAKDLASMNAGSAVPSMTTDILNALELAIPSTERLAEFESVVAPMYQTMQANNRESAKLAELRDTLLPKLMSGEMDVSNIEI